MGRPKLNLVGQVFKKLTVMSLSHMELSTQRSFWNCICECGKSSIAAGNNLKKGTSGSCGCTGGNRTHNLRNHELYGTWGTMIQRCTNPNNTVWKNYGGRGITVCQEWRISFETFLKDMGERPPDHELDRVDNDLGYSKENCKWSTAIEQANNRRVRTKN